MSHQPAPLLDRLANKFTVGDDCWEWTAATDPKGYGRFFMGSKRDGSNRMALAHVVVYELMVGAVPDGLELDHTCRNPSCVRPAHLEPVTHAENVRRGTSGQRNASKTHCKQGHSFDEANTRHYLSTRGTPARQCRTCMREMRRRYETKKRT